MHPITKIFNELNLNILTTMDKKNILLKYNTL
jgi:hypothetical protein